MQTLWARQALTHEGWREAVALSIDDQGFIHTVDANSPPVGLELEVLLPAPANCHSHAFQRAMAGLSEKRGAIAGDSFWSWRDLMYRFVAHLKPDDVEAIAAFVYMEMLESGFAAVAEFHYLHHAPSGKAYADPGEMSASIAAAAKRAGIGMCLLPVFYEQANCAGQALGQGQKRFKNNRAQFSSILESAQRSLQHLPCDATLGLAPHSLRAVSQDSLGWLSEALPKAPIHIHIAEQMAEVDEVLAHYGKRPVEWLMDRLDIDKRWCLVHATHLTPAETSLLAESEAVAGLCPITEANLGDGIFHGPRFLSHGGHFAIGSDSNVRICLAEELRLLEYSQRLKNGGRAVLASREKSTGRTLFDRALQGGAQAAGRKSGLIAPGQRADLLSLDMHATDLRGKTGDELLDSFIFCGDSRMVHHLWSAGRHVVKDGQHIQRADISARYHRTLDALKQQL